MSAPLDVPGRLPRPGADLDELLAARLERDLTGTVLAGQSARVVYDATDAGVWTVHLQDGRARVQRGGQRRPTLVVRGSAEVLAAIVTGSVSGVHAFLDGRITVRGHLGLALQLDALFPAPQASHPRAGVVRALGIRTAYLEAGPADAPPVVLLHGLGATNASMLPVLADLAADHRVLSPDLPGFGQSEAPASPYSSAWFAAWLEAFQSVLHARPAVVIGNSLGGRIALEAGLAHPRSVRALVLLTPSPAFRRLRQFVPAVRLLSPDLARVPQLLPHAAVVEGLRRMFADPDCLPRAWYDAAADESTRVSRSPAHRVALLASARRIYLEEAYGRNGFWDRLPALMPPALFVWGDRDRLVPSSFARHVANALPGAGSVVLEDCGHVPQFEHPLETMAMVRGFLGEMAPPPGAARGSGPSPRH